MPNRATSITAAQTEDPQFAAYRQILFDNAFTGVVPEWEMMFGQIEPSQNNFNWTQCDKIVNWAVYHGLEVDGHALVWDATGYSGLMPGWITSGTWTRTTLLAALENHITKVINRYKDRIRTWRVVNEAFEDNGTRTPWVVQTVIGNDWIEKCFQFAHAADPTATLYYNDYSIEWGFYGGNPKYTAVRAMIADFKSRGIPIHGMGFQCHFDTQFYNYTTHTPTFPHPDDFPAIINDFTSLGVQVDLTELDIRCDNSAQPVAEEQRAQVDIFNLVNNALEAKSGRGVCIWGISDATNWFGPTALAAPWDVDYQPKPFADAFVEARDDSRPWWPEGYSDPAFQVRRQIYGTAAGGDYVRGSSVITLPHTVLRYPTEVRGAAEAVNRAILHVRVKDHGVFLQDVRDANGVKTGERSIPVGTIEITWGWPDSISYTWKEVALVRSAFGRPSTVNDGQTVLFGSRSDFYQKNRDGSFVLDDDGKNVLISPPLVDDALLPPGRWYHYGLFFKVSEVEWVQGMVDSTLLPRDFGHDDHLWNSLPPYYRWTDENSLVGDGHLRQFLDVFGFELDTCREYVESWQHVYDVDWSPIRLLRKLGQNFGLDYEQGIGDIRFRSLISDIGLLYGTRGTTRCLENVINRVSKYRTTVEPGANLMLIPDDSDFLVGTGHWGGPHPDIDWPGTPLAYNLITLTKSVTVIPPEDAGRGVLEVTSAKENVGIDLGISCGCGLVLDDGAYVEVEPLTAGIPVNLGMSYGFAVWVKPAVPPISVQLSLAWFDGSGDHSGYISTSSGTVEAVATGEWTRIEIAVMSDPPVNAVYVVPYVLFDTRTDSGVWTLTSPPVYLAGAMVYAAETLGEAVGPPPNQYLTISDPGEPLGGPLSFKGAFTGTATPLPTSPAAFDAYSVAAPVPTAAPRFYGVTPDRAAQVGDSIYWTGTGWVNIGNIPPTFEPFILGSPEGLT